MCRLDQKPVYRQLPAAVVIASELLGFSRQRLRRRF